MMSMILLLMGWRLVVFEGVSRSRKKRVKKRSPVIYFNFDCPPKKFRGFLSTDSLAAGEEADIANKRFTSLRLFLSVFGEQPYSLILPQKGEDDPGVRLSENLQMRTQRKKYFSAGGEDREMPLVGTSDG